MEVDIGVSNRLGILLELFTYEHQTSTRQMYVAQVGVASILLSGSGQCFLRSVEHLYSVPDMTLEKIFQAVIQKIPPPQVRDGFNIGEIYEKNKCFILQDSWYDHFRGTVNLIQVVNGTLKCF